MMLFKKFGFFQSIVLICISSVIAGCSTFDYFKPSSEDDKKMNPEQERIVQLEAEISQLKQDQTDLLKQLNDKDADIKKLNHQIKTLKNKITYLKKTKSIKPNQYKIEYNTPSTLYKKARNLLLEDNYIDAAVLFTEFIKNHPKDSLADNAVYWLGECHYSMGEHKKAIDVFKALVAKYPKSEKVPDAMLKTGYSYLALDDSNRAHHYLKQVLKKYPFSPASEKAQEKLKNFD